MRDPNYTPTPTPMLTPRRTRSPSPTNNSNINSSSDRPHPSASASPTLPLQLRILTHNIRYATRTPTRGELPWPRRLPHLLAELHYHTRQHPGAIICLQEVLHGQLVDILEGLNGGSAALSSGGGDRAEWAHYGRGRDDGEEAGEYSPILYRAGVWELCAARTVWLSPTPSVPGSGGWDAASVRVCGGVVLELGAGAGAGESVSASGQGEREARRRILVLNTHLDDQGQRSRVEGAKIILREIQKIRNEWGDRGGIDGVVLSGDLNSEAPASERRIKGEEEEEEEEEEDAYTVLNAPGTGLRDIRPSVAPKRRYGHEMTFTGFDGHGDGDGRCRRIDFIHVDVGTGADVDNNDGDGDTDGVEGSPRPYRREGEDEADDASPWDITGYAVLPNRFDNGVYMSDHRAVVGDLLLK